MAEEDKKPAGVLCWTGGPTHATVGGGNDNNGGENNVSDQQTKSAASVHDLDPSMLKVWEWRRATTTMPRKCVCVYLLNRSSRTSRLRPRRPWSTA